jgi:putative transposase
VKLVIEALKEQRTVQEIAADYGLNPNLLFKWRKEFLEHPERVFDEKKRAGEAQRKEEEVAAEKDRVLRKIDILTIERDYLRQSCEKLGIDPDTIRPRCCRCRRNHAQTSLRTARSFAYEYLPQAGSIKTVVSRRSKGEKNTHGDHRWPAYRFARIRRAQNGEKMHEAGLSNHSLPDKIPDGGDGHTAKLSEAEYVKGG